MFGTLQVILFVILEVHSNDGSEGESILNVEGDAMNANKEDELERSTSASKRRRKRSKSDGKEQNKKPVKGTKGKQLKKSLKGCFYSQL